MTQRIVDLLTDKQAEDVVVLNISQIAPFADYFVIASGQTVRQLQALLKSLDEDLGRDGVHPLRREGKAASGWILLDFGDVVVHVFAPEQRRYYDLEALWGRPAPAAVP
ncbi:MAG TPA: ribosome silencing factor [Dehalococcoidia bacterium]|nr:ribosome silencing factor [Dehalococcoidia bacterium]HLB28635.1 ribosome silencing factor [Dehalococcoidia bacterium]